MFIPKNVEKIISILYNAGFEAYVVGGCVRDSLLGIKPHDWDICTSATPEQTKECFKNYKMFDSGIKHGTVSVVIDNEVFEITTYRIDGEYTDSRHPESVIFTTNIVEDLSRRDFTINAMAYNKKEGLLDPFNGRNDLKSKIIRCVGNPYDRFCEDALRILRALRFAARFEFSIADDTHEAILKEKNRLSNISYERINSELCGILMAKNCGNNILRKYSQVIIEFIPELKDIIGFEQNNPHHLYDVWEHTLHCMNHKDINSQEIDVRLALLLHDIGKPHCYSEDNNKIGHFKGHAHVSAEMAKIILKRLRFSNKEIESVTQLIEFHDYCFAETKPAVKKILNKLGCKEQLEKLLSLRKFDIWGQNNLQFITWRAKLQKIKRIEDLLCEIIKEEACFKLSDLSINGKDLIKYGIPEGKPIGKILKTLLEMVINDVVKNNKEDLLKAVDSIYK